MHIWKKLVKATKQFPVLSSVLPKQGLTSWADQHEAHTIAALNHSPTKAKILQVVNLIFPT